MLRRKVGNPLAKYTVENFIINDGVYTNLQIVDDFGQPCDVDLVLPNSMFNSGTQTWDFVGMKAEFDLPNICSYANEEEHVVKDITELGYNRTDANLYAKAPIKWRENYSVSEVLDKVKADISQFEGLTEKEELLYKNARQELKDLYPPRKVVKVVKSEINNYKGRNPDGSIGPVNADDVSAIFDLDELTEDEAALFAVAPKEWKDEYKPRDVVRMMVNRGGTNYSDDELLGFGLSEEEISIYHMAPSVWKNSLMPKDVVAKVKKISNKE